MSGASQGASSSIRELVLAALAGAGLVVSIKTLLDHQKRKRSATFMPIMDEELRRLTPICWQYLIDGCSPRRLLLREWEDVAWRRENGWTGNDLCHNPQSRAVRVLGYFFDDAGEPPAVF